MSDSDEPMDVSEEEEAPRAKAPRGKAKPRAKPVKKRRKRASSDEEDEPSEEEDDAEEEDYDGGRGAARTPMPLKKRAAAASAGARGGASDDDDDAAPDDEEPSDEDDGYGSDFMGDDEDRARLDAMTQLEREMVLAERAERRENAIERRRLREEMRARAAPAARKGKAGPRTRAPTAAKSAKAAALDEIKARTAAQRTEARQASAARREADAARRAEAKRAAAEASDEEEEEYESDGDRRRGRRGRGRAEEEEAEEDEDDEDVPVAMFEDIARITLPRVKLEKWSDKPFFDDAVTGCFVRVSAGPSPSGGVKYRLAQVVTVLNGEHRGAELRSYAFGAAGRRTNKWLLVRHGNDERPFKMELVSNSAPTGDEFESWGRAMAAAQRRPMTKATVAARLAALDAAAKYTWAPADVAAALAAKRAANAVPRNPALEKEMLSVRLDVAIQAGNEEEAELCRAALAECDKLLEALPRGASAMSSINKRNATANVAILDAAGREAAAQAKAVASGAVAGSDADPFSRRPTRVTNYWQTKAAAAAKPAAPAGAENGAAAAAAAAPAETPADVAPAVGAPDDVETPAADAVDRDAEGDERLVAVGGDARERAAAAAHAAAWRFIDVSRCAGPRRAPVLRAWRGGLGAAEEAIRAGKTIISVAEYLNKRNAAAQ